MKRFILLMLLVISVGLNIYLYFFRPADILTQIRTVNIPVEVEALVNSEVDKVTKEIDKKGFEHAVSDAVANTVSSVNFVRDSAQQEMDSVLALRDLDRKQLQKWERYAVSWRDSFLMASQVNDTLYQFADAGLELEFVQPKTDKPYFNYKYDADIDYINYWDKKHFLARKKNYTDFWVNDTRATINGVRRIQVEARPDVVSAKIGIKGLYLQTPYVGPSGVLKVGRIELGGSYLYDLDGKQWVPSVSGTFNLIEF